MISAIDDKKNPRDLDLEQKREKLLSLMNSALEHPEYGKDLSLILEKFKISYDGISRAFLDYNLDVYSHNNSIYQDQAIRVVLHIHNLIAGSWHIERQNAVCHLLKKIQFTHAIDLGFGVPSRYVKQVILAAGEVRLTLCDYQPEALVFAKELLYLWDSDWPKRINFLCNNMEVVDSCVGDYDLYISLHSIEHVANPAACLRSYVNRSRPNALFLIEIPIGPITPEHTIAWASVNEAKDWISAVGLNILYDHITYVNPDVDLFADVHEFSYGGYLMLCSKK